MVLSNMPSVVHNEKVMRRISKDCRVAVETGMGRGEGATALAKIFSVVFTIELDTAYVHKYAQRIQAKHNHIQVMVGNSTFVVPQLTALINENVFWYLDAHTRGDDTRFPLFNELAAISSRKSYRDAVVVDDIHCFGRKDTWGGSVTFDKLRYAFPQCIKTEVYEDEFIMHTREDRCQP